MKKDVAVIIILSVIALGLIIACAVIFGFGKGKSEKVTDFEDIYFTTSPGRGKTTRYIITNEGEETKISISVTTSAKNGGGDGSEKGYCSTEDMIELLNDCDVLSWNGYDEKGDKDMDFRFEGNINGEEIEAKGKMAYPKNFEDFVEGVEDLCREGDE